ncbi:hypothetical protein D3C72_1380520 [compost metagenome]
MVEQGRVLAGDRRDRAVGVEAPHAARHEVREVDAALGVPGERRRQAQRVGGALAGVAGELGGLLAREVVAVDAPRGADVEARLVGRDGEPQRHGRRVDAAALDDLAAGRDLEDHGLVQPELAQVDAVIGLVAPHGHRVRACGNAGVDGGQVELEQQAEHVALVAGAGEGHLLAVLRAQEPPAEIGVLGQVGQGAVGALGHAVEVEERRGRGGAALAEGLAAEARAHDGLDHVGLEVPAPHAPELGDVDRVARRVVPEALGVAQLDLVDRGGA